MSLFLTDTCFWTHVKDVYESIHIDLRPALNTLRWGTTKAIEEEIVSRNLGNFYQAEHCFLVPVSKEEIENIKSKLPTIEELDFADQTLIVAARRERADILTDDGALFLESQFSGLNAMLLPQFCLQLAKSNILDKTTVYQLLRHWENTSRFAARFIKKWKKELQAISGIKS